MNENRFRAGLLRWYKKYKRRLPWRGVKDPYKIWVSEVLLQQTQVKTVIPYYNNFVDEFPDVQSLSRAPLDRVLKVCEGAGYYARFRNFKKAAELVNEEYSGKIPTDADALRKIPGVGEYTAAAISSIAFGQSEPVLDGNVKRVLARVDGIKTDITRKNTLKRMYGRARKLMGNAVPGDFNQAMMELGAVLCLPKNPKCGGCPVKSGCAAFRKNIQGSLPVKKEKKPLPHYECAVGIIHKKGMILIAKRKPEGLLGGLWEFPGGKRKKGETLKECLLREISEEVGLEVKITRPLPEVDHAYSHFRVTLYPFLCYWVSGIARPISCEKVLWVKSSELKEFAFPSANRKIFSSMKNT